MRSLTELAGLIAQVAAAPLSTSEFDWLEWKSEVDLTSREWHARIATILCAFANRDPSSSRAHAGGCAYLLIGVEPGNVPGVVAIDNARLVDGLARFLDTAHVRWSPQYIAYRGREVLILTVEPPREGDPIAVITREYSASGVTCREGDILVRRHGKTERASSGDIARLTKRANASPSADQGILVEATEPLVATPVRADAEAIGEWVRREENRLLIPLRTDPSPRFASSRPPGFFEERRTPEDYEKRVEDYLRQCNEHGRALAHRLAIESASTTPCDLTLLNLTEENYENVEVRLTVQRDTWAYTNAASALDRLDVPTPPVPWGRTSIASYLTIATPPLSAYIPLRGFHGPWVTESEVVFENTHLRPSARIPLRTFTLIAEAALAGQTMEIAWEATSTNASGVARGVVAVSVGNEILTPLNS